MPNFQNIVMFFSLLLVEMWFFFFPDAIVWNVNFIKKLLLLKIKNEKTVVSQLTLMYVNIIIEF